MTFLKLATFGAIAVSAATAAAKPAPKLVSQLAFDVEASTKTTLALEEYSGGKARIFYGAAYQNGIPLGRSLLTKTQYLKWRQDLKAALRTTGKLGCSHAFEVTTLELGRITKRSICPAYEDVNRMRALQRKSESFLAMLKDKKP